MFGHFTQIDNSDQRKNSGSGLGMSISKQIVERHGGQLDYESRLGEGTTFYFDLEICQGRDGEGTRDLKQPKRDAVPFAHAAE